MYKNIYRLNKILDCMDEIDFVMDNNKLEDIKNEINSSQNKDEKVQETNTQVNIRKNK